MFVGNIDFDVPEEKVVEELSAVGRVVSFRIVTDRATGKSKGYGFCTYESPIVANMAVSKLRIMLNNRPVKINYADNNNNGQPSSAATPQEEQKVDLELLAETLERMSPEETKEIIMHFKSIAINRPEELRKMLDKSPSLLSALLHMIFLLNLAPKEKLEDLLRRSFNISRQNTQIVTRILQYHDYEVDALPSPLKEKAIKIREKLLKR